MYGLGDVLLDLLSVNGARPSMCLECDRFLEGRLIFEGVGNSAIELELAGVDAVEGAESRDCHCSPTVNRISCCVP
jgi:hypothetical protein